MVSRERSCFLTDFNKNFYQLFTPATKIFFSFLFGLRSAGVKLW